MFTSDIDRELSYLNKSLTTPLQGNAYSYTMRRIEKLQSKINSLYRFANRKDGKVRDFMLSKLDAIQTELDSIVYSMKYR